MLFGCVVVKETLWRLSLRRFPRPTRLMQFWSWTSPTSGQINRPYQFVHRIISSCKNPVLLAREAQIRSYAWWEYLVANWRFGSIVTCNTCTFICIQDTTWTTIFMRPWHIYVSNTTQSTGYILDFPSYLNADECPRIKIAIGNGLVLKGNNLLHLSMLTHSCHQGPVGLDYFTRFNSSPPSAAYMRRWTGSTLVQIMACRLVGAKPLPKPMLEYC